MFKNIVICFLFLRIINNFVNIKPNTSTMNIFNKAGAALKPLKKANRTELFSIYRPTAAQRRLWLTIATICLACSVGAAKTFADQYSQTDGAFSWNTFVVGSAWGLVCTVVGMGVFTLFALLAKDIKTLRSKNAIH